MLRLLNKNNGGNKSLMEIQLLQSWSILTKFVVSIISKVGATTKISMMVEDVWTSGDLPN